MLRFLISGLMLAWAACATAEVLSAPETGAAQAKLTLPTRGTSMAEVQRRYGEPASRSAAGGTAPKQPLINRWNYDGFSVFFEKDRVIDAVVPGAPPPVAHRDRLVP
ncbi:hypothetical protein RM530_09640 [Algiphilus sp. W345]|uniref:Lipoprotein n=1 Tax=Banduia mediterranea TaxID=3075609 RepID=A0ABU2WKN5_9GAMM|nr:hypothetical protein [Algiphilus sp. W345]MDT0497622.1 hypothetical protein [Algiphilus sp. W345]